MPKVRMLVKLLGVFIAVVVPYFYIHAEQGAKLLYYSEDILAALLLFFVAFSVVAVMIFILLLLDEGLYRVLAWVEVYVVHTAPRLQRKSLHVSQLGGQYVHDSEHNIIDQAPKITTIVPHW